MGTMEAAKTWALSKEWGKELPGHRGPARKHLTLGFTPEMIQKRKTLVGTVGTV